MGTIEITVDDLSDPRVAAFLCEHLEDMRATSPPESTHALDIDGLRAVEVTFWTLWTAAELAACGALKHLNESHAEIKSMRVSAKHRGKGLASQLLLHLIKEASARRYSRLSLETGSMAFFKPARKLYKKFGFRYAGPFGNYREDPNSVYMSLQLSPDTVNTRLPGENENRQ